MITVKNFNKSYKKALLKDVNISFNDDGVHYFGGENGIGKSTFFRCLAGIENYQGEISAVPNYKYFVFDDTPFYTNLSGYDNIKLLSSFYDQKVIAKVAENYLDASILRRKVAKYSLGQRKLLNLIIVEILKPDFLILDEFKNGLDYKNSQKFYRFLQNLRDHCLIFISGHDMDILNKVDYYYLFQDNTIKVSTREEIEAELKKY